MGKRILFLITLLMLPLIFLVKVSAVEEFSLSETNTYNYVDDYEKNNSHYNLSMKNKNRVGDETLLTVLTPGLGGSASHFADFKNKNKEYQNVSNKNNIVNYLCQKLDNEVDILVANNDLKYKIEDVTQYFIDDYSDDKIKHTIVLYETEDAYESNDLSYKEFDEVISRVVYDIKKSNNDMLPKINLIGHSRGGLINLLYALDHPDMVNQIFSIGTPYNGSSTAKIDVELNDCNIGSSINSKDGEKDIVNEELYTSYKNRWNNNIELYQNIDVYALAGETTYGLLFDILTSSNTIDYVSGTININKVLSRVLMETIALKLDEMNNLSVINHFTIDDGWDAFSKSIVLLLKDSKSNTIQMVSAFLKTFITETKYKNLKKRLVWMNDGLVDTASQLGRGYNFFNEYCKIFTPYNTNLYNKAIDSEPSVVHNLETKDKSFINYICKKINMDSLKENTSSKEDTMYLLYDIDSTTVGISGYLGEEDDIEIPARIGDKMVVEIGYGAFMSNETIKTISIPNTVKKIDEYGFCDCLNLENVDIKSSDIDIAYSTMFSGCEELKNININSINYKSQDGVLYNKDSTTLYLYPEGRDDISFKIPQGVSLISSGAFQNSNLEEIDLNNVKYIEDKSFRDSVKLNSVLAPNVLITGSDAFLGTEWYNNIRNDDNEIIILGKSLIYYPAIDDVVVDYDDLKNINHISKNAFCDIKKLTIYIPSNVCYISDNAFCNIEDLNIYVSFNYNNISNIYSNIDNLKFNCDRNLKEYYNTLLNIDICVFDGIDVSKAYVIKQLKEYTEDDSLYVGDVLYKVYEGDYISIDTLNCKNRDSGYYTYYLVGLYYDSGCKNKYLSNEIGYFNAQVLWAKWDYYRYYIEYDFSGGVSYNNNKTEIESYNYYTDIGLLFGKKDYCFDILYWKTNDGKRFDVGMECYMSYFINSGLDKDKRYIKLTAVWEVINYNITYHYNGFNGSYDTFVEKYNFYEEKVLQNKSNGTYTCIGWYVMPTDEDSEVIYLNSFKEFFHENIDLYCKWFKKGTYETYEEYKVTDSGKYKQKYDTINLFEVIKISKDELIELGYKTLKIEIRIRLKEIDEGTQHIYLFKQAYKDDKYLIQEYKIDDASKNYETRRINFIVNLTDLDSDMLFIRFGASGKYNDDWKSDCREYIMNVGDV